MARTIHWQIPFISFDNIRYNINIYEDGYTGEVVTLQGGASPVETEEDTDDDPFLPVRYSTGYIRYIDDSNMLWLDICPTYAFDRYVELVTDEGSIMWKGFIKTEAYSGEWSMTPHEVELPIVSVMGALDNAPYTPSYEYKTFGAFIQECFAKLGATTPDYVYFALQSKYNDEMGYRFFDGIFGDYSDDTKKTYIGVSPNLEKPSDSYSYLDVLKEVCMFSCWQLREYQNDLYFVACDTTNKFNKLAYADLANSSATPEEVDFGQVLLSGNCSADNTISILQGKNQARVEVKPAIVTDYIDFDLEKVCDYAYTSGGQAKGTNSHYSYLCRVFTFNDRIDPDNQTPYGCGLNITSIGTLNFNGAYYAQDCWYDRDKTDTPSVENALTFCGNYHDSAGNDKISITFRSKHPICAPAKTLKLSGTVSACKTFYGDDWNHNPACKMKARLKCGDLYYSRGSGWQSSACDFELDLCPVGDSDEITQTDDTGYITLGGAEKYYDIGLPSTPGVLELSFYNPSADWNTWKYVRITQLKLKLDMSEADITNGNIDYTSQKYNVALNEGYQDTYEQSRIMGGTFEGGSLSCVWANDLLTTKSMIYERISAWYAKTTHKLEMTLNNSLNPGKWYLINSLCYLLGGGTTNWRDNERKVSLYMIRGLHIEAIGIWCDIKGLTYFAQTEISIKTYGTVHFRAVVTPSNTVDDTSVTWSYEVLTEGNAGYTFDTSTAVLFVGHVGDTVTIINIIATSVADNSIKGVCKVSIHE